MKSSNETLINMTPNQSLSVNFNNYLNNSDKTDTSTYSVSPFLDIKTIILPIMAIAVLGTIQIIINLKSKPQESKGDEKNQIKLLNILYLLLCFNLISIIIWINFPDKFTNNQIIYIPTFGIIMLMFGIVIHQMTPIAVKIKRKYNRK